MSSFACEILKSLLYSSSDLLLLKNYLSENESDFRYDFK